MKKVIYASKGKVGVVEEPEPQPGCGQVKIKLHYCAICATDLHIVTMGLFNYPYGVTLGHEATGEVVALGPGTEDSGFQIGDKVIPNPLGTCGICENCRRNLPSFCEQKMKYLCKSMAEYCVADVKQVFKIPAGGDLRHYALAEPMTCAMRAMDLAGIRHGQTVAISGVGGIGSLLLNMILLAGGTRVTAIDPVAAKRQNALAILCSFCASFLVGIFIYKVCYERFFNAPRHVSLLCTIGCSMLLKNLAQMIFGPNQKPLLNVVQSKFFTIGSIQISMLQIIIMSTVVILASLLWLFFNKTRWGICLRAVSQNKDASYLMGINVKRVAMLGNCVGCGLGGVGGILISIHYQTLVATMGGPLSIKAFSSSVLGGLTDTRFSALGGLIIGVIENLGISVSSASFRDIFAFLFLILVLIIKPEGLGAKKGES